MRTRIAWRRARGGDPEARAAVVRAYSYLARPSAVEQGLDTFPGAQGHFANWLRYFQSHPPTAPPAATAIIDTTEWAKGTVLKTPSPRKATATEPEETVVEPEETERHEVGEVPLPAPPPQVREEPSLPATTVTNPPAPPEPRPKAKPARVRPVTTINKAKSELPIALHHHALAVVLSAAPRWYWPAWKCIHIEVADGSVVFFSRGDAVGHWYRLEAETTGAASLQIPREGAVCLRRIKGSGPVVLSLYPDRVVACRDDDPITVPAREARLPRIPEVEGGGLIVAREALALALGADPGDGEVRLQWDRRAFRVNGSPLDIEYASGSSFEVILDARLLREAVLRGTEATVTVEVGGPADPILVSSGALTAAVAPKCEAYL